MEQVLLDLIVALRGSGVRISPSETMDAMKAAALVGYEDRMVLQDSLSAALAKSRHEKELFETCFDSYFSFDGFSNPEEGPSFPSATTPDDQDSPLTQMLLSGDNTGLSISMREAAKKEKIREIYFFTQKSLYVQRILKGMGLEGMNRDMESFFSNESAQSQQKAGALREGRDLLFEKVRDFVESQFSLFAASATEEILDKYLRDMKLSNLEQRDFHRMHAIIKRMVKPINDYRSRRRKRAKRGSLDLKTTLRENIAYQGLIFKPQWKTRKIDRPDMVVLCDVSRSVETVARFMLLFLYSLNEEVAKISSFIFCSNLVEVSHLFDKYDVDEALVRLQKGVGLGIHLGRTDYGQAFKDFKESWLDKVTNKTTILILGDARNNYGNPETGILSLLHKRGKRVIWLNPESPPFWGTGDSDMKKYLPFCSIAKKCSTVNHLERVVGSLLRTG